MWHRPALFNSGDWEFLSATLFQSITAVKIHTREALMTTSTIPADATQRRSGQGEFVLDLLHNRRRIDPQLVVLVTLLGFPVSLPRCIESVNSFRNDPLRYVSLMKKILLIHIREHGEVKSSETKRKVKEPEMVHVDRLFTEFDEALTWMLEELQRGDCAHECLADHAAKGENDRMMCAVFDIPTEGRIFQLVRKHGLQVAMELFRAVCNFLMRYLFLTGTDGRSSEISSRLSAGSLPKKLFVSILPLSAPGATLLVSRSSASRSVVIDNCMLTNRALLQGPMDCIAWNAVHSGTSELIPLILNLFGFEDNTETVLLRQQRDEIEVRKGLMALQRDLDAVLSRLTAAAWDAARSGNVSMTTPSDETVFLSVTAAQCVEAQMNLLRHPQFGKLLLYAVSSSSPLTPADRRRHPWVQRSVLPFIQYVLSFKADDAHMGIEVATSETSPMTLSLRAPVRVCTECIFRLRSSFSFEPRREFALDLLEGFLVDCLVSKFHHSRDLAASPPTKRIQSEQRRTFCCMPICCPSDASAAAVGSVVVMSTMIHEIGNTGQVHKLPVDLALLFLRTLEQFPIDSQSLCTLMPDAADRVLVMSATIVCYEAIAHEPLNKLLTDARQSAARCMQLWINDMNEGSQRRCRVHFQVPVNIQEPLIRTLLETSAYHGGLLGDSLLVSPHCGLSNAERQVLRRCRNSQLKF